MCWIRNKAIIFCCIISNSSVLDVFTQLLSLHLIMIALLFESDCSLTIAYLLWGQSILLKGSSTVVVVSPTLV